MRCADEIKSHPAGGLHLLHNFDLFLAAMAKPNETL
jgi:hypothetical protein